MKWKTIFNPFEKFDDKHILAVGMLFFVLNVFGCFYSESLNDSIFHYSLMEENQSIWNVVKINVLSYTFAIVVLMILAKFINNSSRIIDIINTVLISQIPLTITMPMMGLPFYKQAISNLAKSASNPDNIQTMDLIIVTAGAIATLPLLVYSFVLYFNGFKTATNVKKWQHIVAFVVVSLIVTIISQTIL